MIVTNELVEKIAHLSRLEFNAEETESIKEDLQKMISFVEKLNEIDTTGIEPQLHMSPELNVLREDEVKGSLSREEVLLNAPDKSDRFFMVPKVITRT
jgi:aspartyl-tRNA(Asn)/glutamyl-tRNA(Gln) amidotransferase subunit C